MTHLQDLRDDHHALNLEHNRLLAKNSWNDFALHLMQIRECAAKKYAIEDELERLEEEEAA